MNTPEPCDKCKYGYYNTLFEDDPTDRAKCLLDKPMGNKDCLHFNERAKSPPGTQETKYVVCPGCKKEVRLIKMEMRPASFNKLISFYNGLCIYCGSNLLLSVYRKRKDNG